MMSNYDSTLELVKTYLNGITDREKKHRYKEFQEEGFSGTRHRLRNPFENYIDATNDSVPNKQLEDSLIQMAVESIMLLTEYLRQKELAVKVITFKTEDDAVKLLSFLKSQINARGFVTVSTYYDSCGIESTKGHRYIAWDNLGSARVMHIGDTWFLDLPKPLEMQIRR